MGKISFTFKVIRSCWQVLRQDKRLLIFPAISTTAILVAMAPIAMSILRKGWQGAGTSGGPSLPIHGVAPYAFLVVGFVLFQFVVNFCNAGFIACAIARLRGQEYTIAAGFRTAISRLFLIAEWTLLSGMVGICIDKLGRLFKGLSRTGTVLLVAWSVATYLALPILVVEGISPLRAIKQSSIRLRPTWLQQVVGRVSFLVVFMLLMIPMFLALVLLGIAGFEVMKIPFGPLTLLSAAVYAFGLVTVLWGLDCLFKTALYLYASGEDRSPNLLTTVLQQPPGA